MGEITVSNFQVVTKGILKGTVSVNLGNGVIIHECKIIEKDGKLEANPPQRRDRVKGKQVYHDLVSFEDEDMWKKVQEEVLSYYRSQVEKE